MTAISATPGEDARFSEFSEQYRRELEARCYRILRSVEDSEDAVQEAFLRAWRSRASFRGGSFRGWLHRIATNASLDALERRRLVRWTDGPEADRLLDAIESTGPEPSVAVIDKETLELALDVAGRRLPPRQREALALRCLIGYSAHDAAALLDTSAASVNSSLQRARKALRERLPEERLEWTRDGAGAPEGEQEWR